MDKTMIVSSDGHAMARMPEYRPYLPARYHEEFDGFCERFEEIGYRQFDAKNLVWRLDPDEVERWVHDLLETGRLDGGSDPYRRLEVMNEEGIVGEVLFPDFGLPFELFPPSRSLTAGDSSNVTRTPDKIDVGNKAHNRWLVDFCSAAPERFAPMACVAFDDVEAAVKEITWAKGAGFKGVLIPTFDETAPLFDARFDPIWDALEDLELPANGHSALSLTARPVPYSGLPQSALVAPLHTPLITFRANEVLTHFIWGGVFERHPKLQVALTEQGSGWFPSQLRSWDYSFEGSYLRRDIRETVRRRPSEYFEDHCFIGSSLFSRAEIEARHEIGLDKMLLGMDYPHHEGTFAAGGTREYLRATLGAAHVPPDEARLLLGETCVRRWGFDENKLRKLADQFGPSMDDLLSPPLENLFPRGDVNKPMAANGAPS